MYLLFIPTHRIIANHIYENLKDSLDFKLSKPMLQYGNMKPDVAPSLKSKKHYMNPTFDFVLDEIVKLIDDGLHEDLISINAFSVRLGVITHFLSDFFCLPHHDRTYFSDKLKEHMIYEKNLHYKFKEFSGLDKITLPSLKTLDKNGIKALIEELHLDYVNRPKGYENDIVSSINVSSAIGLLIVENSILYEPQLIAV
ncbi:MAG: hypothetical protein PWR23_295 [Peptostreptococcaceae bacterium]|nr:hypothetical protein [Peptostreptococcaceae bacterium]